MCARVWIFCCAVFLPLSVLADTPLDFSGDWVVSGDQPSGDKASPTGVQNPGGNSGTGGHGGRGGMGGMGGGGHHSRRSQGAGGSNTSSEATSSGNPRLHANALVIRQSEVVFDVAANGQRMVYRFDNRNNYGAPYGGTVTLTWAAPEMVIETHPDGGGSVEEHYTLTPDGKQLNLLIRVQNAGEDTAREIRRTFVRDDGSASSNDAHQPTLP